MSRIIAILLLACAGCATTPRPDYSHLDTPLFRRQATAAVAYAIRVMQKSPPVPIQWMPRPGVRKIGTMWVNEHNMGGKAVLASDRTQCVVYVGPDGGNDQRIFNHEAAHAIDRRDMHDPKWARYFYNWKDK